MTCVKGTIKQIPTIEVVAGDIWRRPYRFTNSDGVTPIDLSIYTEIAMQVRKGPGTAVVASGSLTGGEITVSGTDHNVVILSEITMPDVVGLYKTDIEFTYTGVRHTLVRLLINIVEQITTI